MLATAFIQFSLTSRTPRMTVTMMAIPKDTTLGRGQPEDCVRQLFGSTTKLGAWHLIADRLSEAGCRPTSTLLGVTRLAFPDMLIEMEAMALVP